VADIIKTWPAFISAKATARMFSESVPPFHVYFFTLGRGMPKQKIDRLWFTYQGRIIGWFPVEEIIVNVGQIPVLNRLDGGESDWQIKKDAKVAICNPPCVRLKERIFMDGFRGWRYFDFQTYRGTSDARIGMR
jgi:hypothetical protein